MRRRPLRLVLFLCWLLLMALLVRRDILIPGLEPAPPAALRASSEISWYGIWSREQRIGYSSEQLSAHGDGFRLQQQARLLLQLFSSPQSVDLELSANLDRTALLRDFTFRLRSPLGQIEASGVVHGTRIDYQAQHNGNPKNGSLQLSAPPFLPLNQRPFLLQRLPQPGSKLRLAQFDPFALLGQETVITYQGKEKLLLGAQVRHLHRFSSESRGIRSELWLDEQGKVIREQSPAGLVFLAEPEFKAREITPGQLGPELLPPEILPKLP